MNLINSVQKPTRVRSTVAWNVRCTYPSSGFVQENITDHQNHLNKQPWFNIRVWPPFYTWKNYLICLRKEDIQHRDIAVPMAALITFYSKGFAWKVMGLETRMRLVEVKETHLRDRFLAPAFISWNLIPRVKNKPGGRVQQFHTDWTWKACEEELCPTRSNKKDLSRLSGHKACISRTLLNVKRIFATHELETKRPSHSFQVDLWITSLDHKLTGKTFIQKED